MPQSGSFHADLLQLPHQGSDRNVGPDFFRAVTADGYIVGGDGAHGNPESRTLQMIADARGDEVYKLYFTHPDGRDQMRDRLRQFFQAEQNRGRRYEAVFRAVSSPSMQIPLLGSTN
jgi:hypothetical protein